MGRYGEAVDRVGSPTELVDVATAIFREDLDAGYVVLRRPAELRALVE